MLRQDSFFLDSGGASLAASLIRPEGDVRGLLLVAQPLVEERKASLPPLVEASRRLAERLGLAVLRVDYPGTGDSGGNFADYGLEDWIAALACAVEWLRLHFGDKPLFCLGVRTGAARLSRLPADATEAAGHVFWDPVDGADSVRQWMQRHSVNSMIAYGKAQKSRGAIEAELKAGGSADLDGFELTGRQYAALSSLELGAPEAPTLMVVAGRPSASAAKWAEANGDKVEQAVFHTPPYWNSVGYVDTAELRDAMAAWLTAVAEVPSSQFPVPSSCEGTARPATNPPPLQPSNPLTLSERFVSFESGGATVRGVLTLPKGEIRRTVLFLGGWSGDRQGPHRLFLLYARRLAAGGAASLRIDYRGRGESDLSHDAAGIATMADDAERAAAWLRDGGFAPQGLDVVAICSGCKVALTLATRAEIRHLDLLSAEAMGSLRAKGTNVAKTASALKTYARKLFRRETWRKIFKGEVRTDMVGKALVRHETRGADEAKAEDRVLDRLRAFKGTLFFIYGGSDPDAPGASAAYRTFCRRHGLRASFDEIPHAGHSYYALDWTDTLFSKLDDEGRVARRDATPPSGN